jgi:hypothetical protein
MMWPGCRAASELSLGRHGRTDVRDVGTTVRGLAGLDPRTTEIAAELRGYVLTP